ncbi:adenosine receptor A3-like [Oculina patagonica]
MSYNGEKILCNHDWASKDDQERINLFKFYRVSIIVYVFLTITATLGNILILATLHKDTSLHPPSKLLLRSLTITNLCVGVVSQPLLATFFFSVVNGNAELCLVSKYLVACCVSLFTLTAIGVDRLLALFLRLRYRQVVTVKRVRVAIFLFWLTGSVIGIIYVWSAKWYFIVSGVVILLFVAISTFCYARIFSTIRRQQTQVQDALGSQNIGLNMARYKKTVFNASWVHLILTICYLPFALATVIITIRGYNTLLFVVESIAAILICVNSSLNPVLYCWKIREVRQAVKETVRQVFGFST